MLYGGLAATTLNLSHAMPSDNNNNNNRQQQQHHHDTGTPPRRLELGGTTTRSFGCTPDQHSFLFTLYTDANSIDDNSWRMSHASHGSGHETGNSGTFIVEESLGSGKLGYGAVVTHTICADKAPRLSTMTSMAASSANKRIIESCYDLELSDSNGDGLTAPHSAQGGLAGGFSFSIDGNVAVEHRGEACLSDDNAEWNDCAVKSGFEYCGVRVCTVNNNDGASEAIISSLSGSQCALAAPMCDAESIIASSASSISVNVDTDSYADELSWELRQSTKNDSKKMNQALQNDLLLAGGEPVYQEGSIDNVIMGQPGVGVALDGNESYESEACLPDSQGEDNTCYDFRAYDAYGDGMGCGADGSLSIVLETEEGRMTLEQTDRDMAKRQRVDGEQRLACMNKKKLSKWSYCAVRICADGEVIGLEGNQCEFGFGDDLVDQDYLDTDPLSGLSMKLQNSGLEEDEVVMIELEDIGLNVIIDTDNAADNLVIVPITEEDLDPTWAAYYDALGPEFKDNPNGASMQPNNAESSPNQDKPPKNGQKGPRPNAGKLNNKYQGVKGPKQNSGKLNNSQGQNGPQEPIPMNQQQQQQQGREQTMELKRFSTNLLEVRFPYPLKYTRNNQISDEVSDYLVSYFADKNNRNGPDDEDVAPIKFELDCTKVQRNIGPEKRWVMNCDGTAVFQSSSPSPLPTKKVMNNIIRDAFMGESKEQFLERMYNYDTKKNNKVMKKQKLEAKKDKLQQKQGAINIGEAMDQKKQNKLQKKQMKMDRLEVKNQKQQQKQQQEQGENVMGYVSGSQYMSEMSDSDKGYAIIDGNIHVYIDDDKKGGGRRHERMLRRSGLNGSGGSS